MIDCASVELMARALTLVDPEMILALKNGTVLIETPSGLMTWVWDTIIDCFMRVETIQS